MRHFVFAFLLFFCIIRNGFARDNKWRYSVESNFIVTLNTFSDNWGGTTAGSVIWISKLNGLWKRQLTDLIRSENNINLAFGQTRMQNKKTKKWSSPDKSSDKIDLQTILKFNLGQFIDPYTSLAITSQFLDNRNENSIAYLNPFEIFESLGIARDILNSKNIFWNVRFGCALRQNIDLNCLSPGDSITNPSIRTSITKDGGGEIFSELRFRTGNVLKFSSKIRLYQAFLRNKTSNLPQNDYWRSPDINIENSINIYVTKNILFNYYINVIYNKDISLEPKIKQTLGAGISICFSSKNH